MGEVLPGMCATECLWFLPAGDDEAEAPHLVQSGVGWAHDGIHTGGPIVRAGTGR